MTTMIKELLDDVAAEAVRDLRIDVDDVVSRSRRRRVRLRTTGTFVMLAAAALITAVVVPLVAAGLDVPPAAAGRPVGLPRYWYSVPNYTPPVTRLPMRAASMLLVGADAWQPDEKADDRPVLVSDDGTRYARVPMGPDDGLAALSADGRRVAWVTQRAGARLVVHILRLADAHMVNASLPPAATTASQLLWAKDQLYVVGAAGKAGVTWQVDGETGVVGEYQPVGLPLGIDAEQKLVLAVPSDALLGFFPLAPGLRTVQRPTVMGSQGVPMVSAPVVVDPTGKQAATVVATTPGGAKVSRSDDPDTTWSLQFGRHDPATLIPDGNDVVAVRIIRAEALSWTLAGVLVRVDSEAADESGGHTFSESTLRLVDPETGKSRIVSEQAKPAAIPRSLAAGVVGDAKPIAVGPPHLPGWDRDHVSHVARTAWCSAGIDWQLSAVAALAFGVLVTTLLIRHRARSSVFHR